MLSLVNRYWKNSEEHAKFSANLKATVHDKTEKLRSWDSSRVSEQNGNQTAVYWTTKTLTARWENFHFAIIARVFFVCFYDKPNSFKITQIIENKNCQKAKN